MKNKKGSEYKMNMKNLTGLLMSYVSAMKRNDVEKTKTLMESIIVIFDNLESETSNESVKEEIKNILLQKIEERTLEHLDVATYTRELVYFGFS